LAAVLLAAAAAGAAAPDGDLRRLIRSRGLDPEEITRPLRLNEEMRAWVEKTVPRAGPESTRMKILFDALKNSQAFDFQYQAGYTGTIEEVFETGKFNCLSFSLMFVSLAREVGLQAYLLNLKQDQDFERVGDLVVVSRHLTAGHGPLADRTVLEFDLGPEVNYQLADPITDLEALALYYSNRGAELLRGGEVAAAAESLEIAVTLVPELAQAWVNLGVVRRRLGDLPGAEEAYVRAIDLEHGNLPAYHNLMTLQRLQGRKNAAAETIALLDRRHNRNPFTYLNLGDLSLEEGRLEESERFYRRALRLARYEAEPHAAMGQWALAAGKADKAREWYDKAREIDPDNERVAELGERLRH
jgi:tetratricopeptide (TPR) repeat protein